MNEAHAVGGILKSANSGGKRTHKRSGAKRTKSKKSSKKSKKSSKKSSTSTRRVVRTSQPSNRRVVRTSQTRPSNARVVRTSTRSSNGSRRVVRTTRTTTRPTRRVVRHSRPVRRTHVSSSRTVHHHHHSSGGTVAQSESTSDSGSGIDVYITGGIGTSGLDASAISDAALPGIGWGVGIGGKGKYLGFELGLDGGGYSLDPEVGGTDLAYLGVYGDVKLQPTFSIFEPFVFAGLGAYSLQDGVLNEATGGGALRLGAGANLRFDDFAIGGKYLWQTMAFADDSGVYGQDVSAQSESLSVAVTIYF